MALSVPAVASHDEAHRILFQPIVALGSNAVYGYEALARFDDGRSPLAHLAEARRAGCLTELELSLVASIVAHCRDLAPKLLITVNASAATIVDPRFTAALEGDRRWGVELSEASPTERCVSLREHVDRIDALLLVDDAGSSFSTAERIRQVAPDIVKIDKETLWHAAETGDESAKFAALLQATEESGALCLVEGVETSSHERFAQDRGVRLAQGFHYGGAQEL